MAVTSPKQKNPKVGLGTAINPKKLSPHMDDPTKIANDLMQKDSLLMRTADTKGKQVAASRGLLNSSLAAGESMARMAEAAVPLAQTAAGIAADKNKSYADYRYGQSLADQSFQHEKTLQKATITANLDLAKLDAQTRKELMAAENKMQHSLAKLKLDGEDKEKAANSVLAAQELWSKNFNTILSNQNLSADERSALVSDMGDLLDTQMDLVGEVYGLELDWTGGSWGASSGGSTQSRNTKKTKNTGSSGGGQTVGSVLDEIRLNGR